MDTNPFGMEFEACLNRLRLPKRADPPPPRSGGIGSCYDDHAPSNYAKIALRTLEPLPSARSPFIRTSVIPNSFVTNATINGPCATCAPDFAAMTSDGDWIAIRMRLRTCLGFVRDFTPNLGTENGANFGLPVDCQFWVFGEQFMGLELVL